MTLPRQSDGEFVVVQDGVRLVVNNHVDLDSVWIRPLELERRHRTLGCWHDFHGLGGYRGGMVSHKRDPGDDVLDWATLEETVAAVVLEHL